MDLGGAGSQSAPRVCHALRAVSMASAGKGPSAALAGSRDTGSCLATLSLGHLGSHAHFRG